MTPQEQLLLQQQQKMAGYPTSDKPAIFPPDNGGQQAAAHPRANMFANWGQNGQGNWAKTANPTASQWVDQQKKSMNIGQNANPEPVVAPYAPGTKVVQQPAVQQKTAPAQNTGNTQVNQPITSADDLARAMGYTSPEEEEKLRKASVANQRIMAVADTLRHIGNIANTVGYAPSQQFNSPVEMERQRYLQGKALRDKANLTYINYQQAKAAQDAKQRQWEAQFKYNMDKDARDYALKKNESDARANLNEAKIQRYNTIMELDQARREGVISDNEWRKRRAELYPQLTQSQIARNNRTGGGRSGGSSAPAKYWVYDENGNKHYYHNKTMYEQGVEQYGNNLPQTETYKTTDQYGETRTVERRTPSTKKGGTLARNAESKKTNKTIKGYKTKGGSSNNGKGKAY